MVKLKTAYYITVYAMEHLCGSAYLAHDFEIIIGG